MARILRRRRDLFLRRDGELLVVPVLGRDLDAAAEDEQETGGALETRGRREPDLVVDLPALEIAVGSGLKAGDLRRAHAQGIDEPGLEADELTVRRVDPGRSLELLDDLAPLGDGLVARAG